MKIFPSTITELIWRKHLRIYSPTLVKYQKEYSVLVSGESETVSAENIYICPLCVKNYYFIIDNKIKGNSEFSIDHLPPDSVGGRFKVITCKKCNNDSGGDEAELLTLLNFGSLAGNRYNSVFPYTYAVNEETGEKFRVLVKKDDGHINILFNENAKQHNIKLKNFLTSVHNGQVKKLKLLIGFPDLKKIERALLKSAYLACFVWWGYDFVYSNNAGFLRRVLMNDFIYPARVPIGWQDSEEELFPKGISILCRNGVKEAFLVNLGLKSNSEKFMASILIPGPTENGWKNLANIDRYVEEKSLTSFQCLTLPIMVTENGYTDAWNIIADND